MTDNFKTPTSQVENTNQNKEDNESQHPYKPQHETPTSSFIILSPTAYHHIINYLQKHQHQGVRFSVKKTGCSGLSYVIEYVNTPLASDLMQNLSDHLNLYIDPKSLTFLQGICVDYVKQGLNYKFIFTNPNQTGQCGCGESFTVD